MRQRGVTRLNPTGQNRIGLVTTELGVGGAEKCVTQLAIGLQNLGHRPSVFSLAPAPSRARSQLVDALDDAGIETIFLDAANKSDFLRIGGLLKKGIEARQIDIVQSFLYHGNVVAAWAMKGTDTRRFASLRVTNESLVRKFVHRQALRRAEEVVCVSEGVAGFAEAELNVPRSRIKVIPNGVDIPDVQLPADLSNLAIPEDHSVALAAGRLTPQKGFDWLLTSASGFLASTPTAHLVIVGDGEDRSKIQSLIDTHPQANRIHLLPWQRDFGRLLARTDVFLLPSRWEGMPNALMEAMAMGRPVVANNVEGVAELLGDSAVAQLANDAHEFAMNVTRILRDSLQLGAANRIRMKTEFSYDRMCQRWEELLIAR
ncbi:MAG: glycosyltransferase involved in cell wall biosynthesis [Pirellulaceae bacterium]|jgi:glycosyltransferase involved in cell wall biosynthesis